MDIHFTCLFLTVPGYVRQYCASLTCAKSTSKRKTRYILSKLSFLYILCVTWSLEGQFCDGKPQNCKQATHAHYLTKYWNSSKQRSLLSSTSSHNSYETSFSMRTTFIHVFLTCIMRRCAVPSQAQQPHSWLRNFTNTLTIEGQRNSAFGTNSLRTLHDELYGDNELLSVH